MVVMMRQVAISAQEHRFLLHAGLHNMSHALCHPFRICQSIGMVYEQSYSAYAAAFAAHFRPGAGFHFLVLAVTRSPARNHIWLFVIYLVSKARSQLQTGGGLVPDEVTVLRCLGLSRDLHIQSQATCLWVSGIMGLHYLCDRATMSLSEIVNCTPVDDQ